MAGNVYIIAGPNGAGKTTFAREFLPHYADCRTFINADLIAQGLSPLSPDAAAFRAGRLMLEEIQRLAASGRDFGFESTLSGRTYMPLLRELTQRGYAAHLFFLWLPTTNLALSRIRNRVRKGGHDVPARVVRRRFERSMHNFFVHYRAIAHSWILFDNSGAAPSFIAEMRDGKLSIMKRELYASLAARYGNS